MEKLKLNLGCGYNHLPDYVNVDCDPLCKPDLVWNLETTPWPFDEDSVSLIWAEHSLEHLGQSTQTWLAMIREMYRVCCNDARIYITAPHPNHDTFIIDPTHVRIVTAEGFRMFDQKHNLKSMGSFDRETKLGLQNRVDFQLLETHFDLCDPWHTQAQQGLITPEKLHHDLMHLKNVCLQTRFVVSPRKPAFGEEWIAQRAAEL